MSKLKVTDFYDSHHLRYCDESYLDKRILPFESALNMRDIGGYTNDKGERIKWNKIYRGEELCHLSREDQKNFNLLDLDYIFDFRDSWAIKYKPDVFSGSTTYVNIPVLEGLEYYHIDRKYDEFNPVTIGSFMKGLYYAQVKDRADQFARVLKVLRDDKEAKIYLHCTNGKDRTGFMVALIMLIAGISEEKIISEYSLSNRKFNETYEVFSSNRGTEAADDVDDREFFGVDPDWLKVQLDYIRDNYGNVENYLISNTDLTREDLEIIRENILERI